MFFIFSYWAKNIHIPEEHCYTDFLSSPILFRNKKRWYKMILEDHLHHMWPRTGINFNFLPPFFSWGAISHTSRARGGYWTQVSWSPVGPAPASIWDVDQKTLQIAEQQTVQQSLIFSHNYYLEHAYKDSYDINFTRISPNFHITLKLLLPKDSSNCITNANSKLVSFSNIYHFWQKFSLMYFYYHKLKLKLQFLL